MTWTHRRPAAVIIVSLLQLFVHVLVNFRDVKALTNADQLDNAAKSATSRVIRQLSQSSATAGNDRMLATRQKRSTADDDEAVALEGGDDGAFGGPVQYDEKRKWAKNTVRVWGKRGVIDRRYVDEDTADNIDDVDGALDKRTWSKNKVRVWGKRFASVDADGLPGRWEIQDGAGNDDYDVSAAAEAKRRWSDNRVRVWGKRNQDDIGRLLQSSSSDSVADRQKYAGEPRQVVTALADEIGRNLTVGGERQRGKQQHGLSSRRNNDGNEVSNVLRQRAAVVKRAIDDSAGDADELAWVSDERLSRPVYYGSSSPSSFYRGRWMTRGVKRAGSGAYGGGGGSMGGTGGRFPFYAGEGPKRSWRTNVIRVWGK